MRRELKKMTSSVLALGRSGTGDVAERPIDESGHTVDSETSVNKLTLVTISFLPVLMVRNLLPCILQSFKNELAGKVNIGAILEVDIDHRQAEVGDRPHVIQLR